MRWESILMKIGGWEPIQGLKERENPFSPLWDAEDIRAE